MFENDYMIEEHVVVSLMPPDRRKCAFIADIIVLECIIVTIGSLSILYCVWSPDRSTLDFDKLTRVTYLFDFEACGYKLNRAKMVANLLISNETFGLEVRPIRWLPAIVTVSTRLSAKTRKYIELSLAFHIIWFILAITFRIVTKNSTDLRTLKVSLLVFFYCCIFMICFDASMAVAYVTHIKQSLTKGMILRYSGWSTEIKLHSSDDFAGWLPILASICWLRGFIIFVLNIYICRLIDIMRKKIKKSEVKKKFPNERYLPIPEAYQIPSQDGHVLVFRVGEDKPQPPNQKPFHLDLRL